LSDKSKILVTGSAGFIGFHLCNLLLSKGYEVLGFDGMTDYYDVALKKRRHEILEENPNFKSLVSSLENFDALSEFCNNEKPRVIVHLAAQAGVRYSLDNPRSYINSNLVGTFNVFECAKNIQVDHLLFASTSSVYGANKNMPFKENDKVQTPLTIYSATKKGTESMAHAYAHLWDIPTTAFRFFTVYGPWGRPDMALFKFTKGILENTPIDIYNNGKMYRDFTYVEDLVHSIKLLINVIPASPKDERTIIKGDSLSEVAPYRIVNIGNSEKVCLMEFIDAIESELGKKAIRNYMEMQIGDVPATWADASLLKSLTGFQPNTDIKIGVKKFIDWYKKYYCH
jgi:UDP-glucuronate 4-epimerase